MRLPLLQRLLKQREVATLLSEFAGLLPAADLALVRVDGTLYIGLGGWAQTAPAPAALIRHLLDACPADQAVASGEFVLYPLSVEAQVCGALVARVAAAQNPAAVGMLRYLQRSLNLLAALGFERREVAREALERAREVHLLHTVSETIGNALDPTVITGLLLREATRVIAAGAAAVFLVQPAADGLVRSATLGEAQEPAVYEHVRATAERVLHNGRPEIVAVVLPGVGTATLVAAPLLAQGVPFGAVVLGRRGGQTEFTAGDERLLVTLARQAAVALENARLHREEIERQRLEEELAVGRQIQLSLLPISTPLVPGWEFATIYRPARVVGGDLYDMFELPGAPQRFGLLIADVTGKGVPAALFMACCRTLLRVAALADAPPATVLQQANSFLLGNTRSNLFLTAFYATLDVASGQLSYANGGHNEPLWFEAATGRCHALSARSFMLGAFEQIQLDQRSVTIAPNDVLVFYTDGVTDARNDAGTTFDDERLQHVLAAHAHTSATHVLAAIVDALQTFVGTTQQQDDITILVGKRLA